MRIFTLAVILFSIAGPLGAQAFNSPESVEYDAANNRWFAGNNGNGQILVHTPGGGNTIFASGLASGPHGLEVLDTVLYACDGSRVKGFSLASGTEVFNVNLGATFLNGITSDGVDNLFVTDFTAKKIFRLNVSTGNFNAMVTGLSRSPNGILYDGANNRCVFVTWGTSAPIMAMSLADSSTSTLVPTTFSNIDGINRDAAGNWYISTWGGNALRKYDPTFTLPPVSVMTGLSSPADLGVNAAGDSIGIPNSGSANNVVFYAVCSPTSMQADFSSTPNGLTVQFADATNGGTPLALVWDFGDGAMGSGATTSHTYAAAGTYTVCLIAVDACGSDTTCQQVTVTSTATTAAHDLRLELFPNPAQDRVTILNDHAFPVRVKVYSVSGQWLQSASVPAGRSELSLAGLSAGMLMLMWENEQGEWMGTQKLLHR